MTAGPGHNRGPSMEGGETFRRFAWRKARADLLPTLPIEVLRRRVARAAELGLDYRTYASVRASTGRDVIGFLFSNNALRVLRAGQVSARTDRIAAIPATMAGLAHPPLTPAELTAAAPTLVHAARAPGLWDSSAQHAEALRAVLRDTGLPGDAVMVIGETAMELDWCALGRMAGALPADRYFA